MKQVDGRLVGGTAFQTRVTMQPLCYCQRTKEMTDRTGLWRMTVSIFATGAWNSKRT